MPTIISGQRATAATNTILSDRRVVDMADKIALLEPDKAPLVLFSSMVSRKSVHNPEYKCLEDERIPTIDRVNNSGGYTSGATSIVVDNGGYFPKNAPVRVQSTGEVLFVTAISTNTLTVTRSWGGTAAAAIADNDQLSILGGAALEGAAAEDAKSTKAAAVTNYTQIIRWGFDVTGTEAASLLYGGDDLPFQQRKAALEWAVRAENVFLWGEKAEVTSGTTPRRTTGGIDELISTNSRDFGGSFNLVTFYDFMKDGMRYGSKKKVLFAGRGLVHNISLEAHSFVRKVESDKAFGMEISELVIPAGGRVMVKNHDLFEGDTYSEYGLGVDLANVGYRFLRGRDVKLKTNIQANDVDGREDEYIGEVGLFRRQEKTHFRIKNGA